MEKKIALNEKSIKQIITIKLNKKEDKILDKDLYLKQEIVDEIKERLEGFID